MLDRYIDLLARINNIEYRKVTGADGITTIYPIKCTSCKRKSFVRATFTTGILIAPAEAQKYKVDMSEYNEQTRSN